MSKTTNVNRRCDGITRRDLLRVGGLTALGTGLVDLLALRRASGQASADRSSPQRARNCILIWLDGGPSHLETFDPKPDAPREVRGPLESIATSLPGIQVSECLPQIARRMERLAIVRSLTSPLGEHNFGTHYLLTGYRPTPVLEYPSFHAVAAHVRGAGGVLPDNIAVPDYAVGGSSFSGSGFLPAQTKPFPVGGDPARPDFGVRDLDFYRGLDVTRLKRRREFLERLDRFRRAMDSSADPPEDPEFAQAYRLITSREARQAFDLAQEPPQVRQRYGNRTVGQSCLLARRLIERGVPFVTVNHRGWDTHQDLYTRLKEGYTGAQVPVGLIPTLDTALAALLDDLADRGLLDETLIVVMGEFGRTPKLNTDGGRDHWPRVFSALLAGGGIPGGQVIGASDAVGESPADRPVTPADLVCTMYTLLGIDPRQELRTGDGRPVRLTPEGSQAISELIGWRTSSLPSEKHPRWSAHL